jgi:hypothetical protein
VAADADRPVQVPLDGYTLDEIVEYIVDAYRHGTESILSFHWQSSQVDGLLEQLNAGLFDANQREIRRFEYDHKSETAYLDITHDFGFRREVEIGLRIFLAKLVDDLAIPVTLATPDVHCLITSITYSQRRFLVKYEDKICKQADLSFGQAGAFPSLVYEVS